MLQQAEALQVGSAQAGGQAGGLLLALCIHSQLCQLAPVADKELCAHRRQLQKDGPLVRVQVWRAG